MLRLVSLEEFRRSSGMGHLPTKVKGEDADALMTLMLESAESFVSRYCGRLFHPEPALVSETVGEGEEVLVDTAEPIEKTVRITAQDRVIRVPDVREVGSVTLDGATLYEGDYDFGNYSDDSPSNQIELFRTATPMLTRVRAPLTIKGRFGFKSVPADIRDAVMTIGARRYRERDANFSDAVQMADGSIQSYFRSLPSNIQLILRSYKSPRIAVMTEPVTAIR